jgi:Na+-transporting NADH:ubiquinone oxidoreductase subunit NqrF
MSLKETENLKFLANFTSLILLVIGLILQDYIWLFASLLLKSTTITIVIYNKEQKSKYEIKSTEENLVNQLENLIKKPKKNIKYNFSRK